MEIQIPSTCWSLSIFTGKLTFPAIPSSMCLSRYVYGVLHASESLGGGAARVGSIYGDKTGHSHLSFVIEGETSLHFCTQNVFFNDVIAVDYLTLLKC